MEGVIGYITLFAGNFAPRSWQFCAGQLIPISQNTALFSILGTTYGGNGQTTFALPDLRGRAVVGAGQRPGLSQYPLGAQVGAEQTTLLQSQTPIHTHPVQVNITASAATNASTSSPINGVYATSSELLYNPSADSQMKSFTASITTQPTGNSLPFSTLHPVLGLNYIICLQGVFPSRN